MSFSIYGKPVLMHLLLRKLYSLYLNVKKQQAAAKQQISTNPY